jgi:hypothetical protein
MVSAAGLEQHRLVVFELGGANLRPLQIAQDAERLALLAADLADHLDQRQLLFMGAVGKVEADHIDAGATRSRKTGSVLDAGPRCDDFARRCDGESVKLRIQMACEKAPKCGQVC